ncbi:MAG TPA: glutathione S-transferase N-terminal domain-containing protein [Bdellovibrionota bacterium]|nr:glutathione S-transferase N-terminal domain-containing protein [Bdellovibrionota bacterium]
MELILYHFEGCPYCTFVKNAIDRLQVPDVQYRDILEQPQYRDELVKMNGTRQVPCLLIDGKPMLESADIVRFLEEKFGKKR